MTADVPIACTLSGPELRERERTVLAELRAHTRRVSERPDGYALALATSDEALAAAAAVIRSSAAAVRSCASRSPWSPAMVSSSWP